jgi:hypothetical protein
MSFRAVTQIVALIPYPYLERRFGFMRLYMFSMLLWPATIALFPLLNLVARTNGEEGWVWYGALFVFFMVWAFTGSAWGKCNPPLPPFNPHASFQLECLSWSTMPVQTLMRSAPSTVSTDRPWNHSQLTALRSVHHFCGYPFICLTGNRYIILFTLHSVGGPRRQSHMGCDVCRGYCRVHPLDDPDYREPQHARRRPEGRVKMGIKGPNNEEYAQIFIYVAWDLNKFASVIYLP